MVKDNLELTEDDKKLLKDAEDPEGNLRTS